MKFVCKARLKIKEDKKNEGFHTFYVIELDEIGSILIQLERHGRIKKPVK